MSLVNSIVRGFGSQIGRTAASSMINSVSNQSENVIIRRSNSLSVWQVIKTMLYTFPMFILAIIVVFLFDVFFRHNYFINTKGYHPDFFITFIVTLFFTFFIAKDYYNKNKKQNDYYDAYNEALIKRNESIAKLHQTIDETDTAYMEGKITKREYEVLIRRTNKLLKEYTK